MPRWVIQGQTERSPYYERPVAESHPYVIPVLAIRVQTEDHSQSESGIRAN